MVQIVCGPVQLFLNWYNFFVPVQNLLNGSHYTFLENSRGIKNADLLHKS